MLCFKQPIKKIRINSKILCPQIPSFSRAKPAKRNEMAIGMRMLREAKMVMGTRMGVDILKIIWRMKTGDKLKLL